MPEVVVFRYGGGGGAIRRPESGMRLTEVQVNSINHRPRFDRRAGQEPLEDDDGLLQGPPRPQPLPEMEMTYQTPIITVLVLAVGLVLLFSGVLARGKPAQGY